MPDASSILRYSAFWRFYVRASEDPLLNEILRHFTGPINDPEYPEAVIALPCGPVFSLEIAIIPDLASVNLGLRNAHTDLLAEMGWWDDARWHPHALRWSELEKLHHWSQDHELGWVFGGEYPCYSIRNREHWGGVEGRFPFSDWSRVMAQLPQSSSST